ncbi:Crp/Fnr family transcriptional regulator [Streptomyces sp. NPDC005799]|uniref:Crp/Fnr family transcriptional regulator n=1 Tax=Streptomyces sp. NPDC005799 TaxID=3154678 RepID=UPI0033E4C5D3
MSHPSPESGLPLLVEDEIAVLEDLGHVLRYPSGSVLFGEGEETDFALLIRSGHVKVQIGNPPHIVALRGPGEIIGEMAAVRQKPRSASVFALDDVEALYLPATTWLHFLYDHPRAMHAQLIAADERLEEATRKSVESFLGVEQRLAKGLVELTSKELGIQTENGLALRFSQQDLADLVGASRESVTQVIRKFKERGIVTTGRQVITIRDLPSLSRIAEGNFTASS